MVAATYVRDIDASRAFYELIGLTEKRAGTAPTAAWSELSGGGHAVLLVSTQPRLELPALPLLFYFFVDDLAAVGAALGAAGQEFQHVGHPDHARGGELRIADPDGNTVLIGQRAGSVTSPLRMRARTRGSRCSGRPRPSWRPGAAWPGGARSAARASRPAGATARSSSPTPRATRSGRASLMPRRSLSPCRVPSSLMTGIRGLRRSWPGGAANHCLGSPRAGHRAAAAARAWPAAARPTGLGTSRTRSR